ncbi:MAG: hypothetical protein RJA83_1405 [Pseudomonadota bacterium]
MPDIAPSIYDTDVRELSIFPNIEAAQNWLKNNKLDTSDTSILVPFKDENDKVHFLKPNNYKIFLGPQNEKTSRNEANQNIRIIGAANSTHVHGFFAEIQNAFFTKHIPRLNELEGDTINLADHGFIIIYKKGEKKTSYDFFKFFEDEKDRLIKEIKKAQTNEQPEINKAQFLEALSTLAIDLKIQGGMCYFFWTDKHGNQHAYRDCFKQDANNIKLEAYLEAEQKLHKSKSVIIKEHKSQNRHILRFLIDWCKWTVFAAITAIGTGLILGVFITPPIGTIAAAIVAIVTFVGISSIGFAKADKNNPTTIEWSEAEIEEKSEVTFSSRVKQKIISLHDFFNGKSNKTLGLSNDTSESEISTPPIGVFTTIVSSAGNIPVRNSTSLSSIEALVNSSLSLFTFRQTELKANGLEANSLSLRN